MSDTTVGRGGAGWRGGLGSGLITILGACGAGGDFKVLVGAEVGGTVCPSGAVGADLL